MAHDIKSKNHIKFIIKINNLQRSKKKLLNKIANFIGQAIPKKQKKKINMKNL